jgi:bifunctional DNA-binding transcriptional regulator/antitoxin component of YhaV-PrlF toxin-antitoxin module
MVYRLRVGQKGRTVLPVGLRDGAQIQEGDWLTARLEGGRIVLETHDVLKARIRAAAAEARQDGKVVDRFLDERRKEAESEESRLGRGSRRRKGG